MPDFLSRIEWVWSAIVATVTMAFILYQPVARRLAVGRLHAFLLLVSVAGIIALTLTPTDRLGAQEPYCDLASLGLISLDQIASLNERSLNVLLFVPVGIALGLLPRSGANRIAIALAATAPFAIELMQHTATALGRACEAIDVVDNLTGLAVGLLLAWPLTLAVRAHTGSDV